VRYGIKMGLAVLLALWIAQLYRLQYPNWSVLAVLVLMNAQYVGATANKALMRALGTVVGALIGVFGRAFLNAGGTGDLRIFQNVFLTAVLGVPVVALLWLIMPFLANYWAMNALLFVVCYLSGT
jgi:uncharacterized protein YacL